MIFFPGKKKKAVQSNYLLDSRLIKFGAFLFILYVIGMDYQQGHRGSPMFGKEKSVAAPDAAAEKPASSESEVKLEDGADAASAQESMPGESKPDDGLQIEVMDAGNPEKPAVKPGDTVTVQYAGKLPDGTMIENMWDTPATLVLGDGSLVPGLEKAIVGMHQEGAIQVIVPPELGYNPPYVNPKVKPGSTVAFLVKLVAVKPGKALPAGTPAAAPVPRLDFKALDEIAGQGEVVVKGDKVTTRYTLYDARGLVVGESGGEHSFVLGESHTPQDYLEGIAGMKPGGKRFLILPPATLLKLDLGTLSPHEVLQVEVELVKVEKPEQSTSGTPPSSGH